LSVIRVTVLNILAYADDIVLIAPDIRVTVLHLCTKFEVRRPFRSDDMTHFYLSINPHGDLDLRPFDLETGALYCTLPPTITNLSK